MKKIILVTGGNRGIGKEICRQLALNGDTVILGSRDPKKGNDAAKEIGLAIDVQSLDVTNNSSVNNLRSYIEKKYGKLDVLINNAGIISEAGGILESKEEDYRKVMDCNFFGPWELIKSLRPILEKSGDARIVNMSSGMGALSELENGGYAGYRMSKTALNALTIQLSSELETVKINAMSPGWVKTDMGGKDADREVSKGAETAVWLAINDEIPNGAFLRDKKIIPW